jgi:hypothetical protein
LPSLGKVLDLQIGRIHGLLVAAHLAGRGHSALVVDWDLESQGLAAALSCGKQGINRKKHP